MVHRGRHDLGQPPKVEWLSEDSEETFAHDDLMPGDEDYGHREAGPPECSENVSPGEVGQHHVDHDNVRLEGRHGVEHLGARRDRGDLVALAGKEVLQKLEQRRVIVRDQNAARSRLHNLNSISVATCQRRESLRRQVLLQK